MIKLVVSDMDGTLLNEKSEISKKNCKAIQSLGKKGISFAIASGRDYHGVYSIIHQYDLHCEAILGNGAQYVDENGQLVMSCYMNKDVVEDVVKIFVKQNIPVMIFTTKGFYTPYVPEYVRNAFIERGMKRFGSLREEYEKDGKYAHVPCNQLVHIDDFKTFLNQDIDIIKVEAFSLDPSLIQDKNIQDALKVIPTISYLSSFDDNVEVTDQNAQKGLILEKVIQQKGLKKEEVAVMGDGMNDLTMFERFPYGFAPANAEKVIQDLAYQVVDDCENDGVAKAIELILKI